MTTSDSQALNDRRVNGCLYDTGLCVCPDPPYEYEGCKARPAPEPRPEVILIQPGQRVLLVVNRPLTREEANMIRQRLSETLPEVEIGVAGGIDGVIVLPPATSEEPAGAEELKARWRSARNREMPK